MKVVTIVGARPQFIKAAVVSHKLRKKHEEILIHTGQHFDRNMSDTFFEQLGIPKPNYNLGISGGSHAVMTGRMMISIEEALTEEKPDCVLVYGDTNSTLAGALTAVKMHIPICHVEAGVRTHSRTNPEEINRICVDHISDRLLYCTESAKEELAKEGLTEKAIMVGDPMLDAYLQYSSRLSMDDISIQLLTDSNSEASRDEIIPLYDLIGDDGGFYYLTCHREENTQNDEALTEILIAMNSLDYPTIYPVHPRNRERALRIRKRCLLNKLVLTEPVGYLESCALVKNAKVIVTDSGGLQREAFFAGTKCVTVLEFVCWPETMVGNRNTLSKPLADDIIFNLSLKQVIDPSYKPFGDGCAADRIVAELDMM